MIELVVVVIILLSISFLCSILESVILSISRPYIQILVDKNVKSGKILKKLKDEIEEPIAAILTLNTISHTVGATISGALALKIFGSEKMAIFSAVLTFLILIFSEIIPKTIGAQYWKGLSPVTGYILKILIVILKPVIAPIHFLSNLLTGGHKTSLVSKDEIYNFFKIGYRQGVFDSNEYELMNNIFKLKSKKVSEIMTPRTVVTWLSPEKKISDVKKIHEELEFSRIPLYNPMESKISGIVLRRDIMDLIAKNKKNIKLSEISSKPEFIPESISVLKLLTWMVNESVHLAIVLNEYGDYQGLVTIEDAFETLLGKEIIDEFDSVTDMRDLAKKKKRKKNNL